jgi:hypothetical protein
MRRSAPANVRLSLPNREMEVIMRNRAGTLLAVAGVLPGMLAVPSPMAAAATPDASAFTFLTGTVALSPSDVWAVDRHGVSGTDVLNSESLHWNGHKWAGVSTVPGLAVNGLQGVSATGPSDIWAVGFLSAGSLIERYNGHKWATVPCPCQVGSGYLNAVTVLSSTSAYAAGQTGGGTTLIEHYDGTQCAQVSTPSPADGGYFSSVAVAPSGPFAVAVGSHGPDNSERSLIEQGNGQTWYITHQ